MKLSLRALIQFVLIGLIGSGVGTLCSAMQGGTSVIPGGPGVQPRSSRINQCDMQPTASASPGGQLYGRVRVHTSARSLKIAWSYTVGGTRKFSTQDFPLDYWPTAAVFTKGSLIVAGRPVANAKTKIERWTFTYPALPIATETYTAVVQKQVLYNKLGSIGRGRTSIQAMSKMLGVTNPSGALLVQFADSKDVYRFNMDDKVMALVATSIQLPDLKSRYIRGIVAAEVQGSGYVYTFFGSYDVVPDFTPLPVLIDSGSVGQISSLDSMTNDEFIGLYGKANTWLNYHENQFY